MSFSPQGPKHQLFSTGRAAASAPDPDVAMSCSSRPTAAAITSCRSRFNTTVASLRRRTSCRRSIPAAPPPGYHRRNAECRHSTSGSNDKPSMASVVMTRPMAMAATTRSRRRRQRREWWRRQRCIDGGAGSDASTVEPETIRSRAESNVSLAAPAMIDGGAGDDDISGDGGNDTLLISRRWWLSLVFGSGLTDGGAGDDTIGGSGGLRRQHAAGRRGNDRSSISRRDIVDGGAGDVTI